MKIALNSANYLKVSNIRMASTGAEPVSITSVTARLVEDDQTTLVSGSEITLSVTGATDTYDGMFPASIVLTNESDYWVEATVVADGVPRVKQKRVRALLT